jgi:hypothetical protein
MHRIIFCGDREWTDHSWIRMVMSALKTNLKRFVVIEGEAFGADVLSKECAQDLGLHVVRYPANWNKYGKAAGPIRNRQMVIEGNATAVIAFHNDIANSFGTKDMVTYARKQSLPVWLCTDGPDALRTFIITLQESQAQKLLSSNHKRATSVNRKG